MKLKRYFKDSQNYIISIQERIDKYSDKNALQQGIDIYRKDNALFYKKMKEMGINRKIYLGERESSAKALIQNANSILESVNKRTAELFHDYIDEIKKLEKTLNNGESRTFDLNYTNIKGERVHDNFGVEMRNGQLMYYHMDDSNPEVGPRPSYDSPHNILYGKNGNGILAKALRSQAKSEMGIGEEIYSLTDNEGNKIVVTDPREEVDKNGKFERSFDKGYLNLNIYRITKSGDKELLKKDDLCELMNQSGVTPEDVCNRHTRRGNFGASLRTVLMVKREVDRAVQEGMDMTTSTRS